jgi:parvulin-like peptidyl-prolyl isomerase
MALIVNGEKIDDSVIQREAERLRPDYEKAFSDQPKEQRQIQLLEWSRENVIERVLLNQYAKKHGPAIAREKLESAFAGLRKQYCTEGQPTDNLDADREKKIKQDIEQQLKVEKLLADICKDLPPPSNDDVSSFYSENKDRFRTVEQVRVAHIVKHINWQTDEAAALEAIKKVQKGLNKGEPFELLAEKFSDCPENGGDLGYIRKGQMVEEFEDVVFNLDAGQISNIFRTRFGFHIARIYDRKPSSILELEQVKSQIINELQEQIKTKSIEDFIDRLKNEAQIEEIT